MDGKLLYYYKGIQLFNQLLTDIKLIANNIKFKLLLQHLYKPPFDSCHIISFLMIV